MENEQKETQNNNSDGKFDMELLLQSLEKCLQEDGSIHIDSYIDAYIELHRLFECLGTVFGFVASDVHSKINILQGHRRSEIGDNYESIQTMVNYEESINKLETDDYSSGARTLLRLHRALAFVVDFFRSVAEVDDDAKTSGLAQTAYKDTLAKYHPWLIQKTALVAMYALPTRKNLVKQACKQSVEEALTLLPKVVQSAQSVYDATQKFYEERGILNLK